MSFENLEIVQLPSDVRDTKTRAVLEFLGTVIGKMPLDLEWLPPADIRKGNGDVEFAAYDEGGAIIAAASVKGTTRPNPIMTHLAVAPHLQRQGTGSQFLQLVETEVLGRAHAYSTTLYLSSRGTAGAFFAKNGYLATPRSEVYLPRMYKVLKPGR